ncbi:MAG TPA: fibronectin type III domain-containing protein [Dehalococcoidia bacterium]|nr:fibronectin type III domain-containing protein [Dehalococcoidia bacterium]
MANHTRSIIRLRGLILIACALLGTATITGCSGDRPLPVPEIDNITFVEGEGDNPDMFIVTWEPVRDDRIEGYAIYRAEEGMGPTQGPKSEFELQALTIALQYKDEDLHVTEQYPRTRYYYRISAIAEDGRYGPMSEEVSVVYDPAA